LSLKSVLTFICHHYWQVDSLVAEVEDLNSIRAELVGKKEKGKYLSRRAINARMRKPTGFSLTKTTSRKRRRETMEAASEIHGGLEGASYGLVDAVDKSMKTEKIVEVIEKAGCKKIKTKVLPYIYKKSLLEYEKSHDNMLRSAGIYYSKGVMGKKKYKAVYKITSFRKVKGKNKSSRLTISGCPIPKLVPYHRLMSFVIDIGSLLSVRETLCDGMNEKEKVDGLYRNIEELLISISSFYLNNRSYYEIHDFGVHDTFYIALGGDGAPCGKDDTAVAWLVSVLNIGQQVLSSSENFLLFGANCSENCLPVRRFVLKLMKDVERIQNSVYAINLDNGESRQVRFVFSEFPNDMKMLCFLTGELSNSATYFSSFADVTYQSLKCKSLLTDTFGPEPTNTYKPWTYSHRVKVAGAVLKYKNKISKETIAESTKRSKVTKFIAERKSRQEYHPLLGKLVNNIHVDSLHLKNNACAHAHNCFLDELLKQCSKVTDNYSSFSKLPSTCKFVHYVETLQSKCNLKRLSKKVIKWFDEGKAGKDSFDYRFTGRDSRMFLFNFMYLVDVLDHGVEEQHFRQRIYGLALLCLYLRDAVSLFTRIHITAEEVSKLESLCRSYLRTNFVFYSVNPSVWTIGMVVPEHTKDMLRKYGMGLGLNSMEGREAKHITIAKYAKNTFFPKRWEQIFRHEYVSLIWLRNQGFDLLAGTKKQQTYIPKRTSTPKYCICGFPKDEDNTHCRFCSNPMLKKALVSIEKGKWVK